MMFGCFTNSFAVPLFMAVVTILGFLPAVIRPMLCGATSAAGACCPSIRIIVTRWWASSGCVIFSLVLLVGAGGIEFCIMGHACLLGVFCSQVVSVEDLKSLIKSFGLGYSDSLSNFFIFDTRNESDHLQKIYRVC